MCQPPKPDSGGLQSRARASPACNAPDGSGSKGFRGFSPNKWHLYKNAGLAVTGAVEAAPEAVWGD